MPDRNRNILLIYVKNALRGRVKTRLAAEAGDEAAFRIYTALLNHTRVVCTGVSAEKWICYDAFLPEKDDWPPEVFVKKLQKQHPDLGVRMSSSLQDALRTSDKAMIIGSDCPGLRTSHLEEAFDRLDEYDLVLGPALDGGFYMLGLRTWTEGLFEGIRWSTDTVTETLLRNHRILSPDASRYLLPTLADVDHLRDWKTHGHLLTFPAAEKGEI